MRSFLVYLAGPITGLSYDGAVDWRRHASRTLRFGSDGRIETLSPMRHKEELAGRKEILHSYEDNVLSSRRGIFYRDRLDCTRSDLVLVNMIGATRVSVGTVMEIAWAHIASIPVVLAMEPGDPHHTHPMLEEACGFHVHSLDEALETTIRILMPDREPAPPQPTVLREVDKAAARIAARPLRTASGCWA